MIERADRDGIVLVDLPVGQTERRTAFAIALALLGSAEVAAPFASVPLRQFEAFIPVSQTFIFVNDLITSVLLIAQFVIVRWRAILVLDDGTRPGVDHARGHSGTVYRWLCERVAHVPAAGDPVGKPSAIDGDQRMSL